MKVSTNKYGKAPDGNFVYTPSNVLVNDEEHVEVVGPVWQKKRKHKADWVNTASSDYKRLVTFESFEKECKSWDCDTRQVYITIPPTEKVNKKQNSPAMKEVRMQKTISDVVQELSREDAQWREENPEKTIPDAQPLEGVKTAEAYVNPFEKHVELAASIEHAAHYWKVDMPSWTNHLFRINQLCLEYEALNNAQFATDTGGGNIEAMADTHVKSLTVPSGYSKEVIGAFKHRSKLSFIAGATLSAPSTHSSIEMVEVEKVVEILETYRIQSAKNNSHSGDFAENLFYQAIEEIQTLKK